MVNRDEPEEPDDESAPDPGGDWWPDEDAADPGEAEFDWQLEDLAPPLQPPRPRLAAVPDDPGGADDRVRWGNSPEELLAELLPQVDELAGQVRLLAARIADLEGDTGSPAKGGRHDRFRYERHPPQRAVHAHAELAAWVRWLVGSYQLTDVIPPCWDRHDAVAEELAGLFVAWQVAWADRGRSDGVVGWHEQLAKALDGRLIGWLRGARCGQTCAADAAFADAELSRWIARAADSGGAEHRLTRARRFAPPVIGRAAARAGTMTHRRDGTT